MPAQCDESANQPKPSEPKLKGILKKSSSALDIAASVDGYVATSIIAPSTASHNPQNLYNTSPSESSSSAVVAPLASMASSVSSNSSSADDGPTTSNS